MIKFFVIFIAVLVIVLIIMSVIVVVKPELIFKNAKVNDNSDSSHSDAGKTDGVVGDTKDFVPITDLGEYSFCVGKNYRAIIECSSLNYDLMSDSERSIVNTLYNSFLNGMNFPFDIYIQTREYDKEFMMDDVTHNAEKAKKKYPQLLDYADNYVNCMDNLLEYIGNTKIKKKFIIVSFNVDELSDVSSLSDKEYRDFILDELLTRINIANSIQSVGLKTRLLSKEEIAQCIYSYYHRDYYLLASDIVNGSFLSVAVNGPNNPYVDNKTKFDAIITEAQNKIKMELVKEGISKDELMFYQYADSVLSQIKTTPEKDAFELYQYSRENFINEVRMKYHMETINSNEESMYNYYKDYVRGDA